MKVLHVNRPKNNWTGGDFIKLEKVTDELNKLGVQCDILELETLGMDEWYGVESYDIVHIWNFSMLWAKLATWLAVKKKKKVVFSMIYHDTDVFVPYNFQQIMMDHADACIYETETEIERVKKHLTPKNSYVIPNGIDPWWFEKEDTKVPFSQYVLTVGRIEPNKGQLEAAQACKDLGIPYICIGEPVFPEYTKDCLSYGAMIYPAMSQEKLKRWYSHATVYIQPSKSETWGMAVDEAGSQGVPVVISTTFERQNIPNVIKCTHKDVKSISKAIQQAISQKRSDRFKEELKKRTWKNHAEEVEKIYKQII
jgi:glycosyltransferase involved in cell wall biosynthesis